MSEVAELTREDVKHKRHELFGKNKNPMKKCCTQSCHSMILVTQAFRTNGLCHNCYEKFRSKK